MMTAEQPGCFCLRLPACFQQNLHDLIPKARWTTKDTSQRDHFLVGRRGSGWGHANRSSLAMSSGHRRLLSFGVFGRQGPMMRYPAGSGLSNGRQEWSEDGKNGACPPHASCEQEQLAH